jgi:hypothetical protein
MPSFIFFPRDSPPVDSRDKTLFTSLNAKQFAEKEVKFGKSSDTAEIPAALKQPPDYLCSTGVY